MYNFFKKKEFTHTQKFSVIPKGSGFTLIELLVVVAIIGLLSSVIMASLNSARIKTKNTAALVAGQSLASAILQCDIDAGKVTVPNSTTSPTNALCTVGNSGNWPKVPDGWVWYQYVWTSGEDNLVYLTSTYSGNLMHCGHYPSWTDYYCSPNGGAVHVGLCRLVKGFGCTVYDPVTGIWK